MQEMQVQSLGQEDLLEKEMASHSSILAWEISWIEEPGGLQPMGLQNSWIYLFIKNILFLYIYLLFLLTELQSMWNLSSPTRDQTCSVERQSLSAGPPKKFIEPH